MTGPAAGPAGVPLRCAKYHGLGNDFVVALLDAVPPHADALARTVCARRTGVGADGLIIGTPSARPGVDLVFNLWNADGGVAEISGNGIRCLAHAEVRRRGVERADLVIETLAGDRTITVAPGRHPGEIVASVTMGRAEPGPALDTVPVAPTTSSGSTSGCRTDCRSLLRSAWNRSGTCSMRWTRDSRMQGWADPLW